MEDLSRYYAILKDPNRRKIIEILGSQEKIGFKELRQELGLGVGTVYYHLDMLSDFLAQDKQHKYRLNDRGLMLYKTLKEGNVPPTLEVSETFSHQFAKWLFFSPIFAKTVKPLTFLPISLAIILLGALGTAYSKLIPALFFYLVDSPSFIGAFTLYIFSWISLFLFAEIFTLTLYRRRGNDIQLFVCIGIATLPLAVYPYLHLLMPMLLPTLSLYDLDMLLLYIQIILQILCLLLVSAAFSFGKGIRLDKAIVLSLLALYLNIAVLFLLGYFR